MLPPPARVPPEIAAALEAAALRTTAWPLDARWYPVVASTMDLVGAAAENGAREGLVVIADAQTAGRGRRGRAWSSPPGAGLYLSFLLRPPLDGAPQGLALLTLAAGVAVRHAIARATGFLPDLKWPNDVVVRRRKLAGILAEGAAIGTPLQTVVLGVGVNALRASHPAEMAARATSLEDELGRPADRPALLEEIIVSIPEMCGRLRRGEADDILRSWRRSAPSASGAAVEWDAADGTHRGETAGVDDTGALLVRSEAGVARIVGGEVRWL